jgi:hypothetical protein
MSLDLSDEEAAALVRLLRQVIAADPFPLSPRVQIWRATSASSDRSRRGSPWGR